MATPDRIGATPSPRPSRKRRHRPTKTSIGTPRLLDALESPATLPAPRSHHKAHGPSPVTMPPAEHPPQWRDARGYKRAKVTMPGYHAGKTPSSKGQTSASKGHDRVQPTWCTSRNRGRNDSGGT